MNVQNLTGKTVKGYELRDLIGQGSFGAVYQAFQPAIQREVAVKIILPKYANHPDFIRNFEYEAQLVARLEHPHIVPLYDYWREPDSAALVMRLLRGGSLEDKVFQGPLDLDFVILVLDQIAAALMVAHRSGVIHRDMKPANIMLDSNENAYLADFGIAKEIMSQPQEIIEKASSITGSPAYVSPEQLKSERLSPQTDLYSLGIVLFELITGKLPFGEDLALPALLFKHLHDPIPSLHVYRPDVPAALDHVLQRATAKNPKERFPDALAMARAFKQACRRYEGAPTKQTPRPGELNAAIDEAMLDTLSIQAMTNPYKGLRAFEEADAPDFFGRAALVEQLLERLHEPTPDGAFLVIIGPSGSGKSSVVSAGLIPALRQGAIPGSENWFIVEMQPGHQPFEELSQAILRVAARPPASLHSLKSTENGLLRVMQDVLPDTKGELLLVINQFEELFTQVPQEDVRQHFLNSLVQALSEPDTPLRVIISMRADFYDRPLRYPAFGRLVRSRTEVVLPLSPEELELAIVGPASRVGLILEPGLVQAIVQDVSEQPGALPLMQYALTELFERRDGRTLTVNAYHDSGGVLGALARRAEEIYKGLDLAGQQAARQVLLRLVTVGEGSEDTRRRVRKAELMAIDVPDEALNQVIDLYSKYRLLTFDRDPVTREPTVEVAHEALIREWNRLRAWLANSREDMRTQRRLAALADEWLNSDRNISYLVTGPRLAQLNQWKDQTDLVLTALEAEYLEESNAHRYVVSFVEKRRKAQVASLQRRNEKFLIALVGVLLVAVLVVAVLFGFSLRQRDRALDNERAAERSATDAQSVALAANAQQALSEGDTELAVVLALDAVETTPNPSSSVQRVLADAAYAPGTRAVLMGHEGQVYDAVFSPDGKTIATGGADGVIILWDTATGELDQRLEGHTATVTSLDFSSDGRWLLSGSIDRSVRLWDVATGILISRFLGDVEGVWCVALSPDMQTAVSGTSDDEITVWDVNTGKALRQLEGHTASVYSLAFNHDGTRLLSGSADNTLILWDYLNGTAIRKIRGHNNFVYDVAFSPDETIALSASWDRTLRTWDLATGRELVRLVGHTAPVYSGDFSQTGQYIVSGSEDQTMILWDATTGEAIYQVKAHTGTINRVQFSPDGAMVVSASYDTSARLWRFRNGAVDYVLLGHTDRVSSVAYSPTGQYVLSASWDNSLRLWDTSTGQLMRRFGEQTSTGELVRLLEGHTDRINAIAMSADGKWAASGSRDRSVILWDVETGTPVRQLVGHTDQITGVAFTPDGKYVLSASRDETLRLWEVESGELVREFIGHNDRVLCVAISPDGEFAVSGGRNGFILVWDVETGREIRRVRASQSSVLALAVSPDSKLVASGSEDNRLLLWNIQRSQITQQLEGHTASVNTVAFSPDGQWLISGSTDATVRLWDVTQGEEIRRLLQHREAVTGVGFGPDGRTAVSGSWDYTVLLWQTPPLQGLVEWTHANRYLRELTCRDREQYHVTPLCESSTG
ncbi:MAG: hypothetical protein BroJett018_24380 [Chloroflexota bacterium]|nr:MAG: hypothetical protein BroJett018_24380 [Chloroflexota bacterium]